MTAPNKTTCNRIPLQQWHELQRLALVYQTTPSAMLRIALTLGIPLIPKHYQQLAKQKAEIASPTVRESLSRMKQGLNPLPADDEIIISHDGGPTGME